MTGAPNSEQTATANSPASFTEAPKLFDCNGSIRLDPSVCIFCNMCYNTCQQQGLKVYTKADRASKTSTTVLPRTGDVCAFSHPVDEAPEGAVITLDMSNCVGCGQCALACPTNAIVIDDRDLQLAKKLFQARKDPEALATCPRPRMKKLIGIVAPASRVGFAEAAGLPPGTVAIRSLVEGLRKLGCDYVFDINAGADTTTFMDLHEFREAMEDFTPENPKTVFTSCCPAWMKYVTMHAHDLIPQCSTARSPAGMLCGLLRRVFTKEQGLEPEEIGIVSVMPCVAKKHERTRAELSGAVDGAYEGFDLDAALTTVEIFDLIKEAGVTVEADPDPYDSCTVENNPFDAWGGLCSGSAHTFGRTCGVTEAVVDEMLCTSKEPPKEYPVPEYEDLPLRLEAGEKPAIGHTLKATELTVDGKTYRIGVAAGGQAIKTLLAMLKEDPLRFQLCEVMMCPFGCVGGAGMPKAKGAKPKVMQSRFAGLQSLHDKSPLQAPTENTRTRELIDSGLKTGALMTTFSAQ